MAIHKQLQYTPSKLQALCGGGLEAEKFDGVCILVAKPASMPQGGFASQKTLEAGGTGARLCHAAHGQRRAGFKRTSPVSDTDQHSCSKKQVPRKSTMQPLLVSSCRNISESSAVFLFYGHSREALGALIIG